MSDRLAEIETRLRDALDPISLIIDDDSDLHAGHAGARAGGGHFTVRIVAAPFEGLSRIARHRLVYDALADLIPTHIHALAIEAMAPGEASMPGDAQTGQP